MAEIETDDGRDPTKAVIEELDDRGKEITREAMDIWFAAAQDRLVEAAQQRAGGEGADDSEGRIGRRQNNLTDMLDEFQPPVWVESEQAWVFTLTHAAAVFHEFGAEPHEIRARQAQALAFEWPDAPDEIKEQFEDSFPTVFFNSVEHPGVPAIGMIRYGREEARQRLTSAGFSVERFGSRGGEDGG